MRGSRSAPWLHAQAKRIIATLGRAERDGLAATPVAAVRSRGLVVEEMREPVDTPCGIDGLYFAEDPPRVCVTVAASRGRTNFTVLHEFAHHLIKHDDEINEALAEIDDDHLVEEDLCDTIAAALLIPADVVDELVGSQGPTAEEVAALFEATGASREAACVAASQRLRGPGYVVLADADGTIRFAAHAATPYRIARATRQADNHLLQRAGRSGHARGNARLRFRSGGETPLMHADAFEAGGYVFGVFTRGRAAWVPLNLIGDDSPKAKQLTCGQCGNVFPPGGEPCHRCDQHRCYNCGGCGCETANALPEKQCGVCFVSKKLSQFADADDVCVDCA